MAFTLVLPDGQEIASGAEPYVMSDAEAARARRRGPGQAASAAADLAEAQHQASLLANATPETLARVALGAGRATLGQMALACGLHGQPGALERVGEAVAQLDMLGEAEAHHAARPLQRDPLVFLHARGSLRPQQVRAGQEICRVYLASSAGVTGRQVASYSEASDKGPDLEDWPVGLRTAYRDRYAPWTAWAGAQAVKRKSRHTLHDLALLMAADGWGHRQVAQEWRMDQRTIVDALQRGLYWYAHHAGWVDDAGERQAA